MMNIEAVGDRQQVYSVQPAAREALDKTGNQDQEKDEKKIPNTDEYIHTEESGSSEKTGIYKLSQDENGEPKIEFDAPDENTKEKTGVDPEANGNDVEGSSDEKDKKTAKCTVNTDKVDREIENLKKELEKIKQQLEQASEDPVKQRELNRQLSQITKEISSKDNDSYRKQHASYTNEMVQE